MTVTCSEKTICLCDHNSVTYLVLNNRNHNSYSKNHDDENNKRHVKKNTLQNLFVLSRVFLYYLSVHLYYGDDTGPNLLVVSMLLIL